ncbi:MAG TPA: zinc ribbon domain-containing protein [Vicinamibacterales bacterium]|nr:zinc ribbon domain-containing protein [Vicinamibacterales bacterium]
MPLYEYLCKACNQEFEALVRAQDPAPACPSCKGTDLEKLITAAAMASEDQTRSRVKAERKRRLPKHKAEQNEEYQHALKEHLDH